MSRDDAVAAELSSLYRGGTHYLPRAASSLATVSQQVSASSRLDRSAFTPPPAPESIWGGAISDLLTDPTPYGQVYPHYVVLRDTIQGLFATSSTHLTMTGEALCRVAQWYAEEDELTREMIAEVDEDIEQVDRAGPAYPPGTGPESAEWSDEYVADEFEVAS